MRKKILVLPPMALAFLLGLAINTQSQSLHTLTVHGPRPLAKAANELQVRYRIPITYEDPPFSYENDYDDKTAPQFWGSGKRALIPKEGSLEVEYRISDKTKQPENPTALLGALLQDHINRGNPGLFRLQEANGMYHIIPTQARNEKGIMIQVSPILDTPISFTAADRILGDAVLEVCKALSQATGTTVLLAGMPNNLFLQRHTSRGAANQPARDVLMGLFLETGKTLVWRLNFDGGDRKFILNVSVVDTASAEPQGQKKINIEVPFRVKK